MVTTDAIVEGVHFLTDDPPDTVARKALRVNLSDLAAKGATPAGFVLTLALRDADDAWLKPFAQALGEDATQFGCPLLGGDTVSTPGPLMISVTAFGRVPPGKMVHRSGAKPGDRVMVTGTIGDAALGLAVLKGGKVHAAASDATARAFLVGRYRVPQPRVKFVGVVCANMPAPQWMYPTDLAGDLAKLCGVSGVSAVIDLESIPLVRCCKGSAVAADCRYRNADRRWRRLRNPVHDSGRSRRCVRAGGAAVPAWQVSSIGSVVAGTSAPKFIDQQGREVALERLSYSHF